MGREWGTIPIILLFYFIFLISIVDSREVISKASHLSQLSPAMMLILGYLI